MSVGQFGTFAIVSGLILSLITIGLFIARLSKPENRLLKIISRLSYTGLAASIFSAFGALGWIVYHREYQYDYAVQHTSNELYNHWFRFAATWSGQEGSFLLWAVWTSIIGFIVCYKAGKYENRVMPIYVSVQGFLCAILLKQSPFLLFLFKHPGMPGVPTEGLGLNPSLQNYWMTIHPPTIFFGFASLLVPYSYALAALIWKDYDDWARAVFPYALLTSGVLGLGLFMGGYWAYETLGWHGFWAWDPVENASFFPWLAMITLVHGLHVQRARGGMARTNLFTGILGFSLFLVGTFLTRSGALASKGPNGQLLSVHAFDDISKSGLIIMEIMLIGYAIVGFGMWLLRLKQIPKQNTTGDNLVSRDFAFFIAVILMLVSCAVVTLGSTTPLFLSWFHHAPMAPQASFYNKVMFPLVALIAITLGCVPWLAWRRTDGDTFLRKLMWPWLISMVFGFGLLLWVQVAQRQLINTLDPQTLDSTMHNWISPAIQRMSVVILGTLGFLAALSNSMLAYRVLRKRPLAAGGWIAHVGIGVLILGVIVSNTFEKTQEITLKQDDGPRTVFGYTFDFVGMTGKAPYGRPIDPDYDQNNHIIIKVTPPGGDSTASGDSSLSFLMEPRWYVPKPSMDEESMGNPDTMYWPAIHKSLGHDLYLALASQPAMNMYRVDLMPGGHVALGPYQIVYLKPDIHPLDYMGALCGIVAPGMKPIPIEPGMKWLKDSTGHPVMNDQGAPIIFKQNEPIPGLTFADGAPGVVILNSLNATTHSADLLFSLPDMPATWNIPLAVTYKPWINLVWMGVLISVLGIMISMVNRTIENRRDFQAAQGKPNKKKK